MAAQFLLNIVIAFLWTLIADELSVNTFTSGFLAGIVIVFLMRRFFGQQFYLRRVYAAIKLLVIFMTNLLTSSIHVINHILKPTIRIKPGIFKYDTVLEGEWEIPALALLMALTPGSVVMEVTPEGDAVYIHAMDVEESKDMLLRSVVRYEKAIMEVTR
ncbi:Na+/H+ antiporter subunit E [Lentibacillus sp. CBA3610]|uniref:Na+/H+ antiporter subunit E n=1 Tax=Lentibacillus sp. CBA3610 TaxID=2518176 RepID=UPI0015954BE7|nr:Na+/H+ antiporter subunit E [Lentibacillus sp. CBA3610]QKY70660.1 Na+/H+ antiporter subunit E [Lentibacillus sp. CBA3610]